MYWLFYVELTLAAICWVFMGIYVYLRIKEKYNSN